MPTTLVCFASWEPRFFEGVNNSFHKESPSTCIVIFSNEYASRTAENRKKIAQIAKEKNISLLEIPIDLTSSIGCWSALVSSLPANISKKSEVLFDISTTPREALWYILHILDALDCRTRWIYYRPKDYAENWLSRNALSPHLLLKRSGIALPGRKTCIVALAGFDSERLAQLIERYEPTQCFVGRQTGDQLGNPTRNTGFDDPFVKQKNIKLFDFNCYDASHDPLQKLMSELPADIWEKFNVIGTALGPKPSAITMFMLTQIHPDMGLVYIPSGDYNPEYSVGIDLTNISEGVVPTLTSIQMQSEIS
ncbi:MAG: hypothetical protein V4448_02050 [Pseudomonadota bacterium]